MFILTRSDPLENNNNTIISIKAPEIESELLAAGYQRYERSYKLKYRHREYVVVCPEYRDITDEREVMVIVPEFLAPGRPYPIYVYLYALDLYSANPELGQRTAAEMTRQYFGLTTFSHTTLGRALKRFVQAANEVEAIFDAAQPASLANSSISVGVAFPSVKSTAALRAQASQPLCGRASQSDRQQSNAFCHDLVRERFKEYRRFLL
jgi:hypothetical protein